MGVDEPFNVFMAAWIVSALCGLAMLLRSELMLSWRSVLATLLYHGLLGLSTALVSYEWLGKRAWFVIGLAMLAGLAGLRAADILALVLKQVGLTIARLMENSEKR